ncbi:otoancorin [Thunnus maccoyii]|uniref:otoancorin n=1 Tax=Thunnus maccoyii TaxID=8240 RepID=UPI001C4CA645|nr:otoancorin [Thunnus maccoyii]
MAPKGGTFFFLLIVACAAFDMMPGKKPDFKDMAKKMMMKCKNKGYPIPKMRLLHSIFNNSDLPTENRNADQSNPLQSAFLDVLDSVSTVRADQDSLGRVPLDKPDKMTNKMWNCTHLSTMINLMRNSSEASACYMRAFVAPLSWATLTTQGENNMDSGDYEALLLAAKPALLSMKRMIFPTRVEGQNMKMMMRMLRGAYDPMSEHQRTQVLKWAKEQITENYFNCSLRPSSNSRSMLMERCEPSLKWLNLEALIMMGPYLSRLAPHDVDSSPKEKLCEFFHSDQFRSTLSRVTPMSPRLGEKFLQKFQECFSGQKEIAEHIDKFGTLACYYYNAPDMTPDLSKKFLSQIADCNSPRIIKVKKRLLESVISNSNSTNILEIVSKLGGCVTLLSPKQLSMIPDTDLKKILKTLGPNVQWTKAQVCTLIKNQLGNKKCKKVSYKELKVLQSVMEGVPSCMLKHVEAQEILSDTEGLKNISKRMRRGQLKAVLQRLRENVDPSELVQKLPGPLLRSISLNNLDKAKITSLDQVENKIWSLPQAAFLAKKLHDLKQLQYKRMRSILQGLTCKMIDKVADSDALDLAEAIDEVPQWLSKVQTGCAARKLFATLEKKRRDYFKTITVEELNDIPTSLLLHLLPSKVNDLPDSVCPVFLDKMEEANLSSLPLRSPSRPALTKRALLCLINGTALSGLTIEDVSRVGPLLCELQPSQLSLMVPDVLNSTLQDMASCHHIPQPHRAALLKLVKQTFGDPSDWSAETTESLGPLLLLDDSATPALPNKPWMKDVLYFLKSPLPHISEVLKKKFFYLTITTSQNSTNSVHNAIPDKTPNVELIEELQMTNVYWTAKQLNTISKDTFLATVEILGSISDYDADQLAVLSEKATEAFGPVSQMTESAVTQIGCIAQGFSNSDLEKLPFSLDTLEEIAHCSWNESQIQSVWKSVAKLNNLKAHQLGAAEMVALNRFICGLSPNEIQQLNLDAFKDAVGSMNGIQCSFKIAQYLKSLAVSAFGEPSTWTEAQVSDLGNIIAGLNVNELASLDPSVFPFLSETCITLIPPKNFAALSVAQLAALGPDNAAMVTKEQRAALGGKQLASLERATFGSQTEETESGAPSLSVEGISAFMKPLLFLVMGFLLL